MAVVVRRERIEIPRSGPEAFGTAASTRELQALLWELHTLLDTYGPVWYTESLHRKLNDSALSLARLETDAAGAQAAR